MERSNHFERARLGFYSISDKRQFVDSGYSSDEEEMDEIGQYYQPLETLNKEFDEIDFKNTEPSELPSLTDSDVDFKNGNKKAFDQRKQTTPQIECIYGIYADKASSSVANQNSQPHILMWRNVQEMTSADYKNQLIDYIKMHSKSISKTRESLNIGLTSKKLSERQMNCRRDVPEGRVLLHYLGYNYPKIQDNCFFLPNESRGMDGISLSMLFNIVQCPSVFLFDCNNAAAVIRNLVNYSQDQAHTPPVNGRKNIDWKDWFCFCVTDIGEEIPVELHLPYDFLTSCLYTPAEIALTCHILQHFRISHVTPQFPIDDSLIRLLGKKHSKIMHTILAISDAIAAASLDDPTYDKLIRKDPFMKRVTEGFLLAQFLLRPYQIHPQSYPLIPDLSSHRLWQNVTAELNSLIYASFSPRQDLQIKSIFKMAIETVVNNRFAHYRPEQYSIMLNSVGTEFQIDAFTVLAEFASMGEESRKILARNSNFIAVFNLILNTQPNSASYHPLLYLACALIKMEPNFLYELPLSLDFTPLINALTNNEINADTRALVTAILTSLAFSMNGNVQRFMNSEAIRDSMILELNDRPRNAMWMLLLAKRFHDSPGANKRRFLQKGFHARVGSFFLHKSFEVRAAVMPLLQSFVGVDPIIDNQIFFMVMFALFDCSPLVRFSYITFLSKYIQTRDKKDMPTKTTMQMSESYQKIAAIWTKMEEADLAQLISDKDAIAKVSDKLADDLANTKFCIAIAFFSISMLSEDPNPSVQSAAADLDKSLRRSTVNEDLYTCSSVSPSDSTFSDVEDRSDSHRSFTQMIVTGFDSYDTASDLLYKVFIRQTVNSKMFKPMTKTVTSSMTQLPPAPYPYLGSTTLNRSVCRVVKDTKPMYLAYYKSSRDVCVGTSQGQIYYNNSSIRVDNLSSLEIADWREPVAIAGTIDGTVVVWNTKNSFYTDRFRADLLKSNLPLIVTPLSNRPCVLSSRGPGGTLRLWDIEAMRFAGEWCVSNSNNYIKSMCLSPINPNIVVVGYAQDVIQMIDIRQNEVVSSLQVEGNIVNVCSNFCTEVAYFAATSDGGIYKFNDSMTFCDPVMQAGPISGFTASQTTPIMAAAPVDNKFVIASVDGRIMHSLNEKACCVAAHPNLPLITFGTSDGNIIECEIRDNGIDDLTGLQKL